MRARGGGSHSGGEKGQTLVRRNKDNTQGSAEWEEPAQGLAVIQGNGKVTGPNVLEEDVNVQWMGCQETKESTQGRGVGHGLY